MQIFSLFTLLSYKLRVEGLLLKEEFADNIAFLEPSINDIIYTGHGKVISYPINIIINKLHIPF